MTEALRAARRAAMPITTALMAEFAEFGAKVIYAKENGIQVGRRPEGENVFDMYVYGEWPKQFIDHINGVRDENRIVNLRDVPRHVNNQNQRRPASSNTSVLLGAFRDKKRWASNISVGGRKRNLGMFDTPEQAHAAYLAAKRTLHEGCTI